MDGRNKKKLWMRPVCVLDIGNSAVRFIEHYLVYRLSENVEELRNALDSMPEATEKLYTAMKSLMGESKQDIFFWTWSFLP